MRYVLTDAGAELLAKLGTSGKGLHLTKAQAGPGYSDNPEELTRLVDNQLLLQIAEYKRENATAILTLLVTNHELTTEHKIQQIGIFAMDEETAQEVLFIVGQDLNGDILQPKSYGRVEYRYVVNIKISNALNVVIDVNDTDFLLQKTFYEFINEENIEKAFYEVFTRVTHDPTAMTAFDVDTAISEPWDGSSSDDPTAMSADDVDDAINTPWDGSSSDDPTAMSADDIDEALT